MSTVALRAGRSVPSGDRAGWKPPISTIGCRLISRARECRRSKIAHALGGTRTNDRPDESSPMVSGCGAPVRGARAHDAPPVALRAVSRHVGIHFMLVPIQASAALVRSTRTAPAGCDLRIPRTGVGGVAAGQRKRPIEACSRTAGVATVPRSSSPTR